MQTQFRSDVSQQGDGAPPSAPQPPWWINPAWYCLFFVLPFFLIAVYTNAPFLNRLGQKVNNLTAENVMVGAAAILLLALGSLPFTWRANQRPRSAVMPQASVNRALSILGWVSVACYGIYFSSLAAQPQLVLAFLSGNSDAMYQVKDALEQIPGLTSFMHADLPFLSLYSVVLIGNPPETVSNANRRLFLTIVFFILIRGIMGAERLALIEAAAAYGVPRIAFMWRPGLFRSSLPYIGVAGVFALFCIGEYFRSWQYYQMYYPDFWDFIGVRFFGYFTTSLNNGAGILTHYPPMGFPTFSMDGLHKFLKIFGVNDDPGLTLTRHYLRNFATVEFNNVSGLYAPYLDYGVVGGAVVLLLMGGLTGWMYRSFLSFEPWALLLYPSWYLCLLDIMRVYIWGSSRFLPVIFLCVVTALLLRYVRLPTPQAAPVDAH